MLHGLLWFPLLGVFIGLAWAGWNEYQKIEVYRVWAEGFDRAKYDIYAVLGQKEDSLIWGKPSRKGVLNLQTFSLQQVESIRLWAEGKVVEGKAVPKKARQVAIEFQLREGNPVQIPFTDLELAARWQERLEQERQRFQSKSL
jgi:hypothetical protein